MIEATHRFNGMAFIVLPDGHEKIKDIKPGCIGSDGVRFYVAESMWAKLKDTLFALPAHPKGDTP